jgi:hypothetical protein
VRSPVVEHICVARQGSVAATTASDFLTVCGWGGGGGVDDDGGVA